jgi:hypothetical protein
MSDNPQVEIFGPDNTVHYRRPVKHPDVIEALNTNGYYVICPSCRDGRLLQAGGGILGCLCGFIVPPK